jgi:hypothetical protein
VRLLDWDKCKAAGIDPEELITKYEDDHAKLPEELCRCAVFRVIYGDSVTADTPVLIRYASGVLDYVNIEDVPRSTDWQLDLEGKQYAQPQEGIQIWSDSGFTPLERIIRHATTKNIYRILTHTGVVSVTSDHSLLRPDGAVVTPSEVAVGERLMHADLPLPNTPMELGDGALTKVACFYALGLFYGDGCCGVYRVKTGGNQSTWYIGNLIISTLRKARDELNQAYPQLQFKIYDTRAHCGTYRLEPRGAGVSIFIARWRQLFYTSRKQKRVPPEILNAPMADVNAFMDGYYDADGDHDLNGYPRFDNKGAIGAAGLLFLAQRQGYKTSINTRADKLQIYRVTCTTKSQRRVPNKIKRIEDLGPCPDGEYVYDLQTSNHHFAAGVGKLVVHNTDSVMVNCGPITLSECIRVGKLMSASCTAKFERPNTLNFETIKLRGLFINPKNYSAMEIEKLIIGERIIDALKRAKQSVKGMVAVRRDNAPIASETQNHILGMIVRDGDVEGALAYVKRVIADLLMNRIDISKLVITKGLSKTKDAYESGGTSPVHLQVAEKIKKRAHETGEVIPGTGDRVPFVMLAPLTKKGKFAEKTSELGEDPLYTLKNGAPVDIDYYMYKQLWPAVVRVFTAVLQPDRCRDVDSDMSEEERATLKAHQALFNPKLPHMKQRVVPNAGSYGIGEWVQARAKCLGCGNGLSQRDGVTPGMHPEVCRHCDESKVRAKLEVQYAERKRKHEEAWNTCRTCQGGAFVDVTCANRTCGNFFHRDRMTLDMEDMAREMGRIDPPRAKALILLGLGKRGQVGGLTRDVLGLIARQISEGSAPIIVIKGNGTKIARKE